MLFKYFHTSHHEGPYEIFTWAYLSNEHAPLIAGFGPAFLCLSAVVVSQVVPCVVVQERVLEQVGGQGALLGIEGQHFNHEIQEQIVVRRGMVLLTLPL